MTKNEKIFGSGIAFLILFLSFFCFTTNPASWFDEGIYFQIVNNIASRGVWGVQTAPRVFSDLSLISVGYPVFLPAAFAFKIFGGSIIVLRVVAIFFLLGLVVAFYSLSKQLYGVKLALLSTLLLGTFSPLYGNGKNFLGEVPGLFFFFTGLLFLLKFEKETERRYLWASLAGIFLGLAAASKPIFLLILPALGIAWLWNFRRNFLERRGLLNTFVFTASIFLPLFFWVFTQFGHATSVERIWTHYSNPYYVENFLPLALSNLKRFGNETTPLHFLVLLVFGAWFLGKKLKKGEPILSPEIASFAFSILVFLAYLRTTGWYRNFFPGHVILFLFLAPGLSAFAEYFFKTNAKKVFYVAVSAALLIQLFLIKENLWCHPDTSTLFEPHLNTIPSGDTVFFYTIPQIAARFTGKNFYQYIKMSENLSLGSENIALLKGSGVSRILIPQEFKEEIKNISPCFGLETSIGGIRVFNKRSNCI